MKHIFGPVNSRRLGRSLGIDLFREKTCNLNCIYCEVGPTKNLTCERRRDEPTDAILAEIDQWFDGEPGREEIDVVTVTASGEPTLHADFGRILAHVKARAKRPVCVLTNGTTLDDPVVRAELNQADIVIPSLDAARPASFRKLDRPAGCLDLDRVIEGLVTFSRQYRGRLWLEILFARDINDSDEDLEALQRVIERMRLERIQINTVARPPLESFARPITETRQQQIRRFFQNRNPGLAVDCLAAGAQTAEERPTAGGPDPDAVRAAIIEMLKRRPCTAADIETIFHPGGQQKIEQLLAPLIESGQVRLRSHGNDQYYTWQRSTP